MTTIKDITMCDPEDITALDLQETLVGALNYIDVVCAIITTDSAEKVQAVYWLKYGRGAVACGGDWVWTDGNSLFDIINRVLITGDIT